MRGKKWECTCKHMVTKGPRNTVHDTITTTCDSVHKVHTHNITPATEHICDLTLSGSLDDGLDLIYVFLGHSWRLRLRGSENLVLDVRMVTFVCEGGTHERRTSSSFST